MTQDEINVLGFAFFSGKTLQYKKPTEVVWTDHKSKLCPALCKDMDNPQWRIKPDEPKTEIWCTFRSNGGDIYEVVKDSPSFESFMKTTYWTYIPSLDREVILPEGVK